MKKIMTILGVILLSLIITACFNSGEKAKCTFSLKNDQFSLEEEISAKLKDEKVTTIKRVVNYDLSKLDEKAKKEYISLIKNDFAILENEGFTSSTKQKDNTLILTVDIDFNKVSEDTLKKYSEKYVDFKNKIFTIEQVKNKLEDFGYKCS